MATKHQHELSAEKGDFTTLLLRTAFSLPHVSLFTSQFIVYSFYARHAGFHVTRAYYPY